MIKYLNVDIVFQEIPNEISLAFEITNCPYRCEGCHTPELQQDIGDELTISILKTFIKDNIVNNKPLISCVLFLGGDHHKSELIELLKVCKEFNLKTALYTGNNKLDVDIAKHLDYVKLGQYVEELGNLKSETTNQVLLTIQEWINNQVDCPSEYHDIVDKHFWDLI
jgi:anaerobic ribonucleoside-triphosphate reductase activating protein